MAVTTLSSYDDALKNRYLPYLVKNINTKTEFYSRLKKRKPGGSVMYTGKQFVVPMVTGYPEGIGSRTGASAALPQADGIGVEQATYTLSQLYHRIQVDIAAMEVSKSKEGSPDNALNLTMRGAEANIVNEIGRILMGRGDGVLTNCGVSTTGTTVTVSDASKLRAGMRIDVRDRITGTAVAGGDSNTISSVNYSANTIVVGTALTAATAATDGVYREDSRNADPFGLDYIVDDSDGENGLSNLGGLDRDTAGNEYWKSQVVGTAGTNIELTWNQIQEAFDLVDRFSIGSPKVMVANHAICRKYAGLFLPDVTYNRDDNAKVGVISAGYTGLKWNNIDLIREKNSKSNTMYLVDTDYLYVAHVAEPGFFDKDGAVLRTPTGSSATAVMEALLYYYWTVVAEACSVHARIDGILES